MAKGKYREWLTLDSLLKLQAWARDGLIDKEIADKIGISESTFYEWKSKYSQFSESLKRGKEVIDIEVENSLLKKTMGFTKTIKKAFKVKEVIYKDGKRLKEAEHIEYAEEEVYVQPDIAAIIFWLKNRMSSKWRDRQITDDKNVLDKLDEILNGIDKSVSDNDTV